VEIELDTKHSEMFPYAIALARLKGAEQVFVEPRIKGGNSSHWLVPDILGIRKAADKPYIIVECEKSHGNIFDAGGKIDKWSKDDEVRHKAEFHFILRGKAWGRREQITKFLGSDAQYYSYDKLKSKLGPKML